ncbi:MAG TPA: SDR family NAD(P)-dependent oxidoreductase [Candidatus Anoxymicrobiaceae bacterium]
MKEFHGKVVVITGAAGGIGKATAMEFANRGARIAACDIDVEGLRALRAEIEESGRECYVEAADVSDASQVERFCRNTYEEMGRVDVLVNNAGGACSGRFEEMSLDDWRWIVGLNLWGVIHGCHYFYPRMIEQGGGGHIVNIASVAGLVPLPFATDYCTTKWGVVGFSETLRAEAALHGIGVSAVCPGFVNTGIGRNARIADGATEPTEEERERTDRIWAAIGAGAEKPALAVIRAVEKNIAVARSGFTSYFMDTAYRSSRRLVGFFTFLLARVNDHFME